jgi:hypothetical protein
LPREVLKRDLVRPQECQCAWVMRTHG